VAVAAAGPAELGSRIGRYCKLCELEDFADAELRALIREAFAYRAEKVGPAFPSGYEYRKYWEVALSLRAFRAFGLLDGEREFLGVGAGAEATMFWLTNHARRVFATDLYLDQEEWIAKTPATMLSDPTILADPSPFASCPWNPRRLVVQHMDGRELRYEHESFDGVFSSSSIEHFGELDDVRQALAEMERVLRPGGIAALSTEYRLGGELRSLPGTLMFDAPELLSLLAEPSWELVEPLRVEVSEATLAGVVDFDEAAADLRAGRDWSRYPHIVLTAGVTWTSAHVVLLKSTS
jgi:SAM-dependent methyltransferase